MKLIPGNIMPVLAWNINAVILSFLLFFTGCNFPSKRGNFPLSDMDLVKDIPV